MSEMGVKGGGWGGRLQPSSRPFRAIKNLHGGRELVRMQKSMNGERNSPG